MKIQKQPGTFRSSKCSNKTVIGNGINLLRKWAVRRLYVYAMAGWLIHSCIKVLYQIKNFIVRFYNLAVIRTYVEVFETRKSSLCFLYLCVCVLISDTVIWQISSLSAQHICSVVILQSSRIRRPTQKHKGGAERS